MNNDNSTKIIQISGVHKSFGSAKVVDDISFDTSPGEILGLIGPNGAGKTTTIRMIIDIIKPDSGQVLFLGEKLSETTKNRIGYLPEERGLYRKLTVSQSLSYLASLKGVKPRLANQRADELLEQVGLLAHKKKRIEELSRGMGQLIQFLTAIIHDPVLVILDEPFANLDPVNTELIKEMILALKANGKAIILSTHRMNEVEELCDRIFMINEGKGVLYGELTEIKSRYRNNSVLLEYQGELGDIAGVVEKRSHERFLELFLDDTTQPQQVLKQIINQGVTVTHFEVATPPLHDIFLRVVGEDNE